MDGCISWSGRARADAASLEWVWSSAAAARRVARLMLRPAASARPAATAALVEDEAALLARVAAGDQGRPLEELYRRYEARLYGLGLRLLSDQGLAEELVQETFVRLWQQAHRFDPARGSVGSFLFAIARRLAVDLWRRPSSRPFEPEPQDQQASSDPVENLIQGLTIRDALQTLSPHHRQVLELYLLEDHKQSEIAELLGLPLGTVKTRAYYALRAFKLALQERGIHA
jgi:RNA polymerase sigma-70 factor, ECF subfamily